MIYRFNSVPTGCTFGWGGQGFAAQINGKWVAYIKQAGCHPNNLNWGEKAIVSGEWEPLSGDFENMFPVGETSEKVGKYWKSLPTWEKFLEVMKNYSSANAENHDGK